MIGTADFIVSHPTYITALIVLVATALGIGTWLDER